MKTNNVFLFIGVIVLMAACQQSAPTESTAPAAESTEATVETPQSKEGMIKVTILYPNGEGNTFDMEYYSTKHMPMVAELMGDALQDLAIDKGIGGRTPDDAVPYLAIGYLYFNSLGEYQEAFGPVAEQIVGDIPNYTNTQPLIQVSEVLQ